jgi:phenylpropionate dioxygenase-like ring-hydroxylating dioxygenase large terminal subunit
MTESETAALGKVPFRVTHPQRIPSKRYYDQEFFDLEREHLWPHVWQLACRLEEIPEVGDYVEYKNLDKSVIVVRTKTGVKAFHNACRHRGVQLVMESGNCKKAGFICPFHGWRWNMDGENTFVYGRRIFDEENLEAAELNLVPCRVELWGGCAFINHDNDAPSLLESLGPVTARMDARNVENLRMEGWWSIELPTNWKLAMEAFMEGYHVMRTHPQLYQALTTDKIGYFGADAGGKLLPEASVEEYLDKYVTQLGRLNSGMAGMVLPGEIAIAERLLKEEWPEDLATVGEVFGKRIKDEIYAEGRAKGLPVPDLNAVEAEHQLNSVEYMFPHYFLLPYYAGMSGYRVRPLTPETCLFELWSLAFLPDDAPRITAPTVLPHDSPEIPEIPRQDYSNLPRQQLGLHATGFEYMRLSNQMEGMISNYQRLIDGYLAKLDPQKLAKAQHAVNDGFNRPINDLGF